MDLPDDRSPRPAQTVLIVDGRVPFSEGRDEEAVQLTEMLESRGYRVARLVLPWPAPSLGAGPLLDHLTAFRLLDLAACDGRAADVLVALDAESCILRHPAKVLYRPTRTEPLIPVDDPEIERRLALGVDECRERVIEPEDSAGEHLCQILGQVLGRIVEALDEEPACAS